MDQIIGGQLPPLPPYNYPSDIESYWDNRKFIKYGFDSSKIRQLFIRSFLKFIQMYQNESSMGKCF